MASSSISYRTWCERQDRRRQLLRTVRPPVLNGSCCSTDNMKWPRDVRQLVEKLRLEMILPSVQTTADASAILRHSEAVTRLTRAVNGAVTGHIHRDAWLAMRIGRRTIA